jgi:glycosyltransferase involved in cell wall biosynthesis
MTQALATIGVEIGNYASSTVATGIQRVITSVHTDLTDYWKSKGIHLAPTLCQKSSTVDFEALLASSSLGRAFVRSPRVAPDDCDVLLLLDLDNGIDYSQLRALRNARGTVIVAVVYDVLPLHHPEWFPEHAKRNFHLYLQQVLYAATHIVVNSEKVKSDLLNLGWTIQQDISVIPLGAAFPPQNPTELPKDQVSLLYVSTIEPRKGHDLLLDAFDLLLGQGVDVNLGLVGHQGWNIASVIERIKSHAEFGGRLKWYEGVSDQEITRLARDFNIGVMPSRGEGFGLFIEEGLQMGLKMIVSEIPEFTERAQPNLTYCSLHPAALAEAILKAHKTKWISNTQPRTMRQFSYDFSRFIERLVSYSTPS